ncbi:MAG: glycosyltransferase [Pseudomonadota bacterium]
MTQRIDPFRLSRPSHGPVPRVLQLLPAMATPAMVAHVLSLVRGLVAAGGAAVVAAPTRAQALALRRAGALIVPWAGAGGRAPDPKALVARVGGDIDIVHIHAVEDAETGVAVQRAFDAALVLTEHARVARPAMLTRLRLARRLRGAACLAVSPAVATALARAMGAADNAVAVVPAGIDMTRIDPAAVPMGRAVALTEAWGLVEDPRPIVLVTDVFASAPWLRFVLAAASDPAAPDAIWALSACDDNGPGEMGPLLTDPRFSARVRWIGPPADWPASLKLSSVLLDAGAAARGHARAALDAQAFGKPVLLPDGCGMRAFLPPGAETALYPPDDPAQLAQRVASAVRNTEHAGDRARLNARLFVATHHGHDALHTAMRRHYAGVLTARLRA